MNPIIISIFAGALLFNASFAVSAQNNSSPYPPEISGSRTEIYKQLGDVKLSIYIFEPENLKPGDQRAGAVFFFGGGWTGGTPRKFEHQCKYLASRGMVAFAADYRVLSRHGTPAVKCVSDGKSAVRWIRENALRLGVDPNRIMAGGGSAGGHVAAATGAIPGFDELGEDFSLSSRPNSMVLFNPVLVLAPTEELREMPAERLAALAGRLGVSPEQLSPFHRITTGIPPTLIFHGKADKTVPYETVDLFARSMEKAGNRCELAGFENQSHGFFNFGRDDNVAFRETLKKTDSFLQSLGYLKGAETVDDYLHGVE